MFQGERSPRDILNKAVDVARSPEPRRILLTKTLKPFLPFEVHEQEGGGLAKAEAYLKDGYGLVVVTPHFSLGEIPRELGALTEYGTEFRKHPILAPIARHQYGKNRAIADAMGVRMSPITTPGTKQAEEALLQKGKSIPWKILDVGAGSQNYIERAVEVLNKPGIVEVAPQVQRQATLEPFPLRAIGGLDVQIKRRVPKVAFVFMGVEVKNFKTYSPHVVGGLNPFKKYEITFGEVLPRDELWQRAQDHGRTMDEEVYAIMLDLAPQAYRPVPPPETTLLDFS